MCTFKGKGMELGGAEHFIDAFIDIFEWGEGRFAWTAIDPFGIEHFIDWKKNESNDPISAKTFKSREKAYLRAFYVLSTSTHWLGIAKGLESERKRK